MALLELIVLLENLVISKATEYGGTLLGAR